MTDGEKMVYCGTICHAARQLGIYGRLDSKGFHWLDAMARARWTIGPESSDVDTLVKACESLVNYLAVRQNTESRN